MVGMEEFDKVLTESDLIGLVGIARPCQCHGHTSNPTECHPETGKCLVSLGIFIGILEPLHRQSSNPTECQKEIGKCLVTLCVIIGIL